MGMGIFKGFPCIYFTQVLVRWSLLPQGGKFHIQKLLVLSENCSEKKSPAPLPLLKQFQNIAAFYSTCACTTGR